MNNGAGIKMEGNDRKPSWFYVPLAKNDVLRQIDSIIHSTNGGAFALICVDVFYRNSNTMKYANNFRDIGDLLGKLMDMSLTCSIAKVNTGLGNQILFISLVETDGLATNIDVDVMDALAKLEVIKE